MIKIKNFTQINEDINNSQTLFTNIIKEISNISNDPNDVKEFILKKFVDVKIDENIFNKAILDFKSLKTFNLDTCLHLVGNIIDKKTGIIGDYGIGALINSKAFKEEKMKAKRLIIGYIFKVVREKICKELKYQDDVKEQILTIDDNSHLPEIKKLLSNSIDNSDSLKEITLNFINTKMIPSIISSIKSIDEKDILNFLNKNKIEISPKYKVGDIVKYKKDDFNDNLSIENQADKLSSGEIKRIDGDFYLIYNKGLNKEVKKGKEDVVSLDNESKSEASKKLAISLGKIKNNDELMSKVFKFSDFIQDEKNKEKMEQVDKLINYDS